MLFMVKCDANFTSGICRLFCNRQEGAPIANYWIGILIALRMPLVVLVVKKTVSFGEIFSGIFTGYCRAHLNGETTDGNVEIFGLRIRRWLKCLMA